MSTAWAGGTDAIIERMDQMTELFVAETRKAIYTGESASHCEECGEPIPEARRKAIACKYCLPCQTQLEQQGK
ncbi:TraR/DksA C4-type zinc finger protein [Methylomonas montana]|uniref:TraR/DksA C4-type zinc finger protein n=1 Tax=Methylomonas montana TaxID=3058963 RepID=UPI002659126A|nr:TraR/DksA C4-type zinc finger protein [Methylomonas montana]WKJ88575.1 TraR/DksA C4-type zinc finger protein [Methylomonas montana]